MVGRQCREGGIAEASHWTLSVLAVYKGGEVLMMPTDRILRTLSRPLPTRWYWRLGCDVDVMQLGWCNVARLPLKKKKAQLLQRHITRQHCLVPFHSIRYGASSSNTMRRLFAFRLSTSLVQGSKCLSSSVVRVSTHTSTAKAGRRRQARSGMPSERDCFSVYFITDVSHIMCLVSTPDRPLGLHSNYLRLSSRPVTSTMMWQDLAGIVHILE